MRDSTWLLIGSVGFLVIAIVSRLTDAPDVQYWVAIGLWGFLLGVHYVIRHLEKIEKALEAHRE